MSKLVRLTPEIRDDFVAYLDGELDDEATRKIEAVIAQSEVARGDMEALAQTYELLDTLERAEASDDFATRTMATIRVDELRPDPRDSWWYRATRQGGAIAVWAAALIGAAAVGYLTTSRWVRTPADELVEQLPLIEQLDLYTEVGNIEFLQRLSTQEALLQELRPQSQEAPQ
jgi:anti-sigma factor RsiW